MSENFFDPSKLDLGNNNSRGEGRGGRSLARIDKRVSSTIRVWVGDGSWRRRISRGVEFRPKNRAREPLVGAWNIGRRFTAATARKGRARKVWHGWSKLFLPLLFPSGGEKSVEDFPSRAFQWMSDRGGREGGWKVGSWFNPFDNEKYKRASIKSFFNFLPPFVVNIFLDKSDSMRQV